MDVGLAIRRAIVRALESAMPAYGVAWEHSAGELRELLRGAGMRPGRVQRAGVSAIVEGTIE